MANKYWKGVQLKASGKWKIKPRDSTIHSQEKLKTIFFKKEETISENRMERGFPGGTVVKNPPANAGDTGSIPGPGRSHMPKPVHRACALEPSSHNYWGPRA